MGQDDSGMLPDASAGALRELREALRAISHDLNGALNNLALNLELLERSLGDAGVPAPACERYAANLRRALGQLTQIAGSRLGPLAKGPAGSAEG